MVRPPRRIVGLPRSLRSFLPLRRSRRIGFLVFVRLLALLTAQSATALAVATARLAVAIIRRLVMTTGRDAWKKDARDERSAAPTIASVTDSSCQALGVKVFRPRLWFRLPCCHRAKHDATRPHACLALPTSRGRVAGSERNGLKRRA